jgi:hypothetical protein
MKTEHHELRWIHQTARPLRYVFIVDPESADISKYLDDIFALSLKMWGGRRNVIIPLIKGKITSAWWKIFKICDPDRVIALSSLSEDLHEQIYRDICPIEIISENRLSLKCPVSAIGIPKFQNHIFSGGRSKRYYLISQNKTLSETHTDFVKLNFGHYDETIFILDPFKSTNHSKFNLNINTSLVSFIQEISSVRNEMPVFPIDICGMYSSNPFKAEHNHFSASLQIILGNSPLDLIYFWNRHLYTEGRNGRETVWIPPELLNSSNELSKAIGEWIQSSYYVAGSGSNTAYLVSFSIDNLDTAAKIIKKNLPLLCVKTQKMLAGAPPTISVYSNNDETNHIDGLKEHLISLDKTFVESKTCLLSPPRPPFSFPDTASLGVGHYAIDFQIEHLSRSYMNRTEIMQIPQRFSNSSAFFCDSIPDSRINGSGYPTAIISTSCRNIELKIPSIERILENYKYPLPKTSNPAPWHSQKPKFHLSESKDGLELKRLISLFENIDEIGNFLTDHFLIKISYELSNIKSLPKEAQEKYKILRGCITEIKKILAPDAPIDEKEIINCMHILDERMNIFSNKTNNELSITEIISRFGKLKGEAIQNNRNLDFWNAYANFEDFHREQLNYYYQRGIFFQGFREKCPFCSYEDWYNLDSITDKIRCHSCSASFFLELSPTFQIRINELLAKAFKKNSYLYVAWALYHLKRDSYQSSFFYLQSQDIYPLNEDRLTDLDLIIIKNGRIGIGEVKSSPTNLIKNNTLQKLEKAAKLFLPDEVYICAPSDEPWSKEVEAEINKLQNNLSALNINTIRYPIPQLVKWTETSKMD